ncbi:MAG: zinc ribbon domain-containing protein [Pseudomonadota bacterium]
MIFNTLLPSCGALQLQQCIDCGHVNYPPRELCGACLSDNLQWQAVDDSGTILTQSELHYSLEPGYTAHLPLTISSIQLDCGPIALAHTASGCKTGERVSVKILRDTDNNRLLVAIPQQPNASHDVGAWLKTMGFQEITS